MKHLSRKSDLSRIPVLLHCDIFIRVQARQIESHTLSQRTIRCFYKEEFREKVIARLCVRLFLHLIYRAPVCFPKRTSRVYVFLPSVSHCRIGIFFGFVPVEVQFRIASSRERVLLLTLEFQCATYKRDIRDPRCGLRPRAARVARTMPGKLSAHKFNSRNKLREPLRARFPYQMFRLICAPLLSVTSSYERCRKYRIPLSPREETSRVVAARTIEMLPESLSSRRQTSCSRLDVI